MFAYRSKVILRELVSQQMWSILTQPIWYEHAGLMHQMLSSALFWVKML